VTDPYIVRAATEDDWPVLREVRLRALADAPTAFETTLAQAQSFPEERWRARSRGSASSRDFLAFAATGVEAVGMAGLFVEDPGVGEIISVWVQPDHRGQRLAVSLVDAAMQCGRDLGLPRMRLWVTEGNRAAECLYTRLGFAFTGSRQPITTRPHADEREMVMILG
jgi:ribosomal protein S18 acetylase RimI-like enzyme